jgi:hypothetical protein
MEDIPTLTVAERFYNNHKVRVTEYQKNNPDKMRAKCKAYNERVKAERPDLYQSVLEIKRKYYHEVTKPKRDAKKKEIEMRIAESIL